MFGNLSREPLEAIPDALLPEFIFVDGRERLIYANKGHGIPPSPA